MNEPIPMPRQIRTARACAIARLEVSSVRYMCLLTRCTKTCKGALAALFGIVTLAGCFAAHGVGEDVGEPEARVVACVEQTSEDFSNDEDIIFVIEGNHRFASGLEVGWPVDDPEFMWFWRGFPAMIDCDAWRLSTDWGGYPNECPTYRNTVPGFAGEGYLLLTQLGQEAPYYNFRLPCAASGVWLRVYRPTRMPDITWVEATGFSADGGEVVTRRIEVLALDEEFVELVLHSPHGTRMERVRLTGSPDASSAAVADVRWR